jgi:predicted RNA-binding Zn ribbon-like protein
MPAVDAMVRGVRLVGALGFQGKNTGKRVEYRVLWQWWIQDATLQAVCGLAIASIYHAGLQRHVGVCARKGCGTYFVDRNSRGIRRKYCQTTECQKALNRARVARSRTRKHR